MRYLIFFLLVSCVNHSWQQLRSEGELETHRLAVILHEVDTKEELIVVLPQIKKIYTRIAELVLEVKKLEDKGPLPFPSEASDALFAELARLYEMPGCRALLEQAQVDALVLLDR